MLGVRSSSTVRRFYSSFVKPERIVLFGPPVGTSRSTLTFEGAGKGTQSEKIERDYGVPTFSTGDYLRKAVREQTPLGKQVASLMKSGG